MSKVLFKADLDDEVTNLIKQRVINKEEFDVARVCLACLFLGADKTKVKKLANCSDFEAYWLRLKAAGYFNEDKTINIEDLTDNSIPFVLMICCAKGHIIRQLEASG